MADVKRAIPRKVSIPAIEEINSTPRQSFDTLRMRKTSLVSKSPNRSPLLSRTSSAAVKGGPIGYPQHKVSGLCKQSLIKPGISNARVTDHWRRFIEEDSEKKLKRVTIEVKQLAQLYISYISYSN